jgi:hypothetical protein
MYITTSSAGFLADGGFGAEAGVWAGRRDTSGEVVMTGENLEGVVGMRLETSACGDLEPKSTYISTTIA